MNEILALPIATEIGSFALGAAFSGACICVVVLAAARLIGPRFAPWSYGILMAGVLGLLAIPPLAGVGRSLPAGSLGTLAEAEDDVIKIPADRLLELLARPGPDVQPADAVPPLSRAIEIVFAAVWILGTAIGLGRLLLALAMRNRAVVGPLWQASFWTDGRKGQLAQKLGLKSFPAVHLSPVVPMPMVIGIRRPRIVLPEQAPASWDQPQWEAVLLHEGAHIARRDHWAVPAQRLAVILFWWCPLVYVLSRRLSALRESICDEFALQGQCDHIAYAELLVESAERLLSIQAVPLPLALLDSARGGLEARVTRLLAKERSTMTKLSLPGKFLGAGVLAAACLLTTAATAFSGGQPQPQKKTQIKVIVDGKEIDLGDPQLWQNVEAAQKKAAPRAMQNAAQPVTEQPGADPRVVTERALHGLTFELFAEQPNPDPRIEELVKQAEAIRPGSGAEVRSALQGAAKAGKRVVRATQVQSDTKATLPLRVILSDMPHAPGDKSVFPTLPVVDPTTGKHVIVLSIEDGKVIQLQDGDLKKLLEKGAHADPTRAPINLRVKKAGQAANAVELPSLPGGKTAPQPGNVIERKASPPVAYPANPTEPSRTNEMDALRRQLERITAELRDLQQRLDSKKK